MPRQEINNDSISSKKGGRQAYGLQIGITQAHNGCLGVARGSGAALHVDDNDELDARVGHPAVHGKPLVDGLQEAKVLVGRLVRQASFKDVQG